jgi:hypothetical protein
VKALSTIAAAYLVAGIAHYLSLVRDAHRVRGWEGVAMRQGLTGIRPTLFALVCLSWPLAVRNHYRSGRRRIYEPAVFLISAAGLWLLSS